MPDNMVEEDFDLELENTILLCEDCHKFVHKRSAWNPARGMPEGERIIRKFILGELF